MTITPEEQAAFQQEFLNLLGSQAAPVEAEKNPVLGQFVHQRLDGSQNVTNDTVRGGRRVYRQNDASAVINAMTTESLRRLQDTLVANGVARNVAIGYRDDETIRAIGSLMTLGNMNDTSWDKVLDSVVEAGGFGADSSASKIDPYQPPDYATLAEEVREYTKGKLGRDPTQAELSLMSDEMLGLSRMAYDSQVDYSQDRAAGREVSAPSVDAGARFRQAFESRYAGELEQKSVEEQTQGAALETASRLGRV